MSFAKFLRATFSTGHLWMTASDIRNFQIQTFNSKQFFLTRSILLARYT